MDKRTKDLKDNKSKGRKGKKSRKDRRSNGQEVKRSKDGWPKEQTDEDMNSLSSDEYLWSCGWKRYRE